MSKDIHIEEVKKIKAELMLLRDININLSQENRFLKGENRTLKKKIESMSFKKQIFFEYVSLSSFLY